MFLGTPHWHCTRSRWSQRRLRQPHQPALGGSRGSQSEIFQSCRRAHRNGMQASPSSDFKTCANIPQLHTPSVFAAVAALAARKE